jgi:hypothetical protein
MPWSRSMGKQPTSAKGTRKNGAHRWRCISLSPRPFISSKISCRRTAGLPRMLRASRTRWKRTARSRWGCTVWKDPKVLAGAVHDKQPVSPRMLHVSSISAQTAGWDGGGGVLVGLPTMAARTYEAPTRTRRTSEEKEEARVHSGARKHLSLGEPNVHRHDIPVN